MQYTKKPAIPNYHQNISKMKKILLLLVMTSVLTHAQQFDIEKLSGMKFRSIGPAGMSGRITAVDVVHDKPSKGY